MDTFWDMFGFIRRTELREVLRRLEEVEKGLREPVEVSGPDLTPLESRLARLELEHGKQHLEALALMEKVARRLTWRETKRVPNDEELAAGDDHGAGVTSTPAPPTLPFRTLRSW